MKAENMQSPVDKFKITIIDKDNAEIEFFANISRKTKQEENSKKTITVYEYDYYRLKLRNRPNLSEQITAKYNEWLEYAAKLEMESKEYIPTDKEKYYSLINSYKAEILRTGFDYKGHQQKCREKDLALLGNAIAANEDAATFSKTPVTHWSFNDGDVVEITVEELRALRVDGATFVQSIFTVETMLKSKSPNLGLVKEDFINEINAISPVKCYEPKKLV